MRSLTQLAGRLTQDHADAEDLVQTAIMRLIEHSERLPHDLNARAWLYTVIRRLAIDRSRKQQRWREVELMDQNVPVHPIGPLRSMSALGSSVDAELEAPAWSKFESPQVERALEHCRPEYRVVFHLYSYEGLAYQCIAGRLGLPLGTVATRLRRARRQIRQTIELAMAHDASAKTDARVGHDEARAQPANDARRRRAGLVRALAMPGR